MPLQFLARLLGLQATSTATSTMGSCPDLSSFAVNCGLVDDISQMSTKDFSFNHPGPQLQEMRLIGAGKCTSIVNFTYSTTSWSAWSAMACTQGFSGNPKKPRPDESAAGWISCISFDATVPASLFDLETTDFEWKHGNEVGLPISARGKWSTDIDDTIGSWSSLCEFVAPKVV